MPYCGWTLQPNIIDNTLYTLTYKDFVPHLNWGCGGLGFCRLGFSESNKFDFFWIYVKPDLFTCDDRASNLNKTQQLKWIIQDKRLVGDETRVTTSHSSKKKREHKHWAFWLNMFKEIKCVTLKHVSAIWRRNNLQKHYVVVINSLQVNNTHQMIYSISL